MKKNSLTREEAEEIYNTLRKRVENFVKNSENLKNSETQQQETNFKPDTGSSKNVLVFFVFITGFLLVAGSLVFMYSDVKWFSNTIYRASIKQDSLVSPSALEELALQLEAKRINLDQRELELQAKEGELRFIEAVLNEKLEELKSAVNRLKALKEESYYKNQTKIDLLVNLVLAMPAKEAAGILQGLDNDVVVEILSKMPERRSGAILNFFNRDRAVRIAKLMSEPEFQKN